MTRNVLLASVFVLGAGTATIERANAALAVTWNPGGAAPALGTSSPGIGSNGNAFTYTSLGVADFASITAGAGGSFAESGFLDITGANMNSTPFTPVGIGGVTGANGQQSGPYTLYFQFSAAGNQTAPNFNTPGSFTGNFSALTYQLYGVNGTSAFSVAGGTATVNNNGNTPILLASGSLIPGGTDTNQVGLSVSAPGTGMPTSGGSSYQISPTASNLNLTFAANSAESGFFVTPPSSMLLDFTAGFTNDPQLVTLLPGGQAITINGGRGTLTPAQQASVVPEPASLVLLGTTLAGLGMVGYRRKRG